MEKTRRVGEPGEFRGEDAASGRRGRRGRGAEGEEVSFLFGHGAGCLRGGEPWDFRPRAWGGRPTRRGVRRLKSLAGFRL